MHHQNANFTNRGIIPNDIPLSSAIEIPDPLDLPAQICGPEPTGIDDAVALHEPDIDVAGVHVPPKQIFLAVLVEVA